MHPEFDLDLTNPKGLGIDTADPALPSDHGEHITDQDIEKLKSYISGLDVLTIPGTIREHRYLAKIRDGNKSTVIFIPGGVGWLYSIDAGESPAGFVYPLTVFPSWPDDVNLIVVDMDHDLGWLWASKSDLRLQNVDLDRYQYLLTRDLLGDPYSKKLITAFHDMQVILQHVSDLTKTKIWLAGHCNSCDMLARFYDFSLHRGLIDGLIFTSPLWVKYWHKLKANISYFKTPLTVPLIVLQHRDNANKGCHAEIATKVISDSKSTQTDFIELDGGQDLGLPHFSMGYHGFRGIESQLVSSIIRFINQKDKFC
jgi:hypothetical protein